MGKLENNFENVAFTPFFACFHSPIIPHQDPAGGEWVDPGCFSVVFSSFFFMFCII